MNDLLLYRYFANEATLDEVQQIESWLESDPVHQREFDAAHTLFNISVLQQITPYHAEKSAKGTIFTLHRVGRMAMRVAAVLVLILGTVYFCGSLMKNNLYREMSEKKNILDVPAGQRMSITLEDGTVVTLNGGTRIEYPALFAKNDRRVKLSGEALFKVAHDASKPFIVETFASEIEALGTTFGVYADAPNFSAVLVEGRVLVRNRMNNEHEQLLLAPNEKVQLVDGCLWKSRVTDPDILCWMDGYINVRNIEFDELMHHLENAYGVHIRIERTTLPQIGYTSGKIRISEGVDFALRLLQKVSDFTYVKDSETNTIIIR